MRLKFTVKVVFPILCLFYLLPINPCYGQDSVSVHTGNKAVTGWIIDEANALYAQLPWITGCNYQPSSAINQIEIWQAKTFDPVTIDMQLGWAHELGFNTMRVYLSSLVWKNNLLEFKREVKKYLQSPQNIRYGRYLFSLMTAGMKNQH